MKQLTQKLIYPDGTESVRVHIYSTTGHFERNGIPQGNHIELGTNDTASNYTETQEGQQIDIPESLPDIIPPDEDTTEATLEDYKEALKTLGVEIGDETDDTEND